MLSDRSYMRDSYEARRTSVLTWLISAIAAAFVLQNVFARWFGTGFAFERLLGLTADGLRAGHVWVLLTYGFLHPTGNLLEILGNLLALYFIGRELVPMLGGRRFLAVYAAALMAGGALWSACHWGGGGMLLGASPAILALFMVFACFFPDRPIQLLILFLFPVTFKPKYLAIALVAIDLLGFAFYEMLGNPSPFDFAPSAHLGGIAVGWIYYRWVHDTRWPRLRARPEIELPRWMKRGAKAPAAEPTYRVNVGGRSELRAEVDRILDKINAHGFGSLSAEEKRRLDEARDALSRR
jgi:membrane associated rhomboid family serine protease